jgi:hypothetical protein
MSDVASFVKKATAFDEIKGGKIEDRVRQNAAVKIQRAVRVFLE